MWFIQKLRYKRVHTLPFKRPFMHDEIDTYGEICFLDKGFRAGRGGGGVGPWGGQRGAHHFELQPLVCIVSSGKVITLNKAALPRLPK